MAVFPETSYTLIKKLSADVPAVSEAAWARFFDLYVPVMRRFVEWNDKAHDPDDVVQDVLLKLLEAVDHVLTRTALSRQSKDVYRAHVLEGKSAAEVAAAFGMTKGNVAKIKFRVEGMVAALESDI